MTSCTVHLSDVPFTEASLKPTGRILVYDLLKLVAAHPWEVVTAIVLLKLRISPGGGIIL
jgi:hypothetical protein